jgi:hypothetical protein
LAAPLPPSFLFANLSSKPITGLPSRSVGQFQIVGAGWMFVH